MPIGILDIFVYAGFGVISVLALLTMFPYIWKKNDDFTGVRVDLVTKRYIIIDPTKIPGTWAEIKETNVLDDGFVEYKVYNDDFGFSTHRYMKGELVSTLGSTDAVGYGSIVYVPVEGIFPAGESAEIVRRITNTSYGQLEALKHERQEKNSLKKNKAEEVATEIKRATDMMASGKKDWKK